MREPTEGIPSRKVALLFPILGRVLPRDLSPLKPVLVEGVWDRVRSRLVPLSAGGRPDEGFLEQPQFFISYIAYDRILVTKARG